MKTALLLALSAPLLASPVGHRDVTVRYTADYANAPTPRAPLPKKKTPSGDEVLKQGWDGVLNDKRPLPTSVLMNMGKLLDEADGDEDESEAGAGEKAGVDPLKSAREEPDAHKPDAQAWTSDAKIFPFAVLLAFSTLGLLACAIQRWRKPRGEIYLHVEEPKQRSLSLRADQEVGKVR